MTATRPAERPKTDPVSNAEKDPDNWTTGDERTEVELKELE